MKKMQFTSSGGNLLPSVYSMKSYPRPQHVSFRSNKVEVYKKRDLSLVKRPVVHAFLIPKLNVFTSSIPDKKYRVNCVLSIGYRCSSADFLNTYHLRKFSGPFDYMYIDMETCFKVIHNNYDDFLNDIIVMYRNEQSAKLLYPKKTSEIKENIYELLEKDVGYMAENYNNNGLAVNQNYVDEKKLSGNLYDWNNICIFFHHAIQSEDIRQQLKMRCERSQRVMQKYGETTCLFFISKIVGCLDIMDYMNGIIRLKQKYKIVSFLTMILCCNNLEDTYFYNESNKCLFIVKKVEDYETQYSMHRTDNNYVYDKEYNIMSQYFDFQLLEKNEV